MGLAVDGFPYQLDDGADEYDRERRILMDWKLERCPRYLYVLELENGKFYVGQAKDPDKRIRKHFDGAGSEWTRLHRPIKELSRNCLNDVDYREGELAENELVLQLMRQHGHHSVRGGFFSNTSVEHVEKNLIVHGYDSILSDVTSILNHRGSPEAVALSAPSAVQSSDASDSSAACRRASGADYGLFVLKLEAGHYFVGYSTKPDVRIKRHFAGTGADWTALHKPIEVLTQRSLGFVTESEAAAKTADATVALMRLFGWKKVRGGAWRSIDNEATLKQLRGSGYRYV